jgi:hypothetical protein
MLATFLPLTPGIDRNIRRRATIRRLNEVRRRPVRQVCRFCALRPGLSCLLTKPPEVERRLHQLEFLYQRLQDNRVAQQQAVPQDLSLSPSTLDAIAFISEVDTSPTRPTGHSTNAEACEVRDSSHFPVLSTAQPPGTPNSLKRDEDPPARASEPSPSLTAPASVTHTEADLVHQILWQSLPESPRNNGAIFNSLEVWPYCVAQIPTGVG